MNRKDRIYTILTIVLGVLLATVVSYTLTRIGY